MTWSEIVEGKSFWLLSDTCLRWKEERAALRTYRIVKKPKGRLIEQADCSIHMMRSKRESSINHVYDVLFCMEAVPCFAREQDQWV
jgi:hypothetical protein